MSFNLFCKQLYENKKGDPKIAHNYYFSLSRAIALIASLRLLTSADLLVLGLINLLRPSG